MHLALGDAQVAAHIASVILADSGEAIHVFDVGPDQIQRLRAVWFGKLAEEQVLALQRAADRAAHSFSDGLREADQQRIRQRHDIGRRLAAQPGRELVDLLALAPVFTAQHGNRHLSEQARVHRNRPARCQLQRPLGIPQFVDDPRRFAEQPRMLLQIHADASEEDLVRSHVGLVGERRGVDRKQDDVVPLALQLGGQRVVADAASAVHLRGAGGEGQDLHRAFIRRTETPGGRRDDRTGCLRAAGPN